MARIHILSPYVANQIAAGEVVERPASVLKEALENSLDAGSTQIDVMIHRGGIGLIQVQDNGCGICKEDLSLALAQHATSKIITSEDLEGVLSLGFRGEALASISAVSKIALSSKTQDSEYGWCIQKEGRNAEGVLTPVSLSMGTRLEIRDLFYNTPARRKFLKSEKTEWGHIQETFKRIALSHPAVALSLSENDHLHKRLPACAMDTLDMHAKRVATLCGEAFMNQTFYIEAENNGLRLKGWLGTQTSTRAQPDIQYFYVNGRIVRDKVVTHAIRQAYQDCPPGRYPAYVLYFECDPMSVDVNVHPTKYEVRFRESRTTHAFLAYSIQEGLKQKSEGGPIPSAIDPMQMPIHHHSQGDAEADDDLQSAFHQRQKNIVTNMGFGEEVKALSILGGELLLAENAEGGLWIADIKRVRYQSTLKALQTAYDNHTLLKRPLLIPKMLALGAAQISQATLKSDEWARVGFEMDQVGPEELWVRAVPHLLSAKVDNLEILILALFSVSDAQARLEKIAHYVSVDSDFSTIDALALLKQVSFEEYHTLYKQISVDTLREILYRR